MHTPESIKHLEEQIEYHRREEKLARDRANVQKNIADQHWIQAGKLRDTLARVRAENGTCEWCQEEFNPARTRTMGGVTFEFCPNNHVRQTPED